MARQQVDRLRQEMRRYGIDAYLILTDDFHSSEYVGDYFKCREYVSGFDGSAGTLVVTEREAGLWTDGRYFIQAAEQLEGTGIMLRKTGEEGVPSILDYLKSAMRMGQCLGYDGRTVSASYAGILKEQLKEKKIRFEENMDLVGIIWEERPPMSAKEAWLLGEEYAGKSRRDKLKELRETMKRLNTDAFVLSSLDDIAWLYNIRGNDIEYNPVVLSYTIVTAEQAILYANPKAVSEQVRKELAADGVNVEPYLNIYKKLTELDRHMTILLDENHTNVALRSSIPAGVRIVNRPSPVMLAKAVKNPVEMEHEYEAHIKDGVAVTKLIYWVKQKLREGKGASVLTEWQVCEKLEEYRSQGSHYLGQSFAPIAAAGAHGAIVHYEPTVETSIPLVDNSFLLLDTGGQYLEGTTDITRTIACGVLSEQQKQHYTAVLRGNLNLAAANFKYGCAGSNLEYLARSPLWELGLDYNHGTGHGVGYLLNVHEAPNAIRLKEAGDKIGTVFEEGMVTSDEPGIYLEGEYGIRLENLILCKKDKKTEYGQFMKFETLTLAPFDREAILPEQMSERERQYLNAYHKRVCETLTPYLTSEEADWLAAETAEL